MKYQLHNYKNDHVLYVTECDVGTDEKFLHIFRDTSRTRLRRVFLRNLHVSDETLDYLTRHPLTGGAGSGDSAAGGGDSVDGGGAFRSTIEPAYNIPFPF
jgi:hypothetical protein